jgi:hypothetical protein
LPRFWASSVFFQQPPNVESSRVSWWRENEEKLCAEQHIAMNRKRATQRSSERIPTLYNQFMARDGGWWCGRWVIARNFLRQNSKAGWRRNPEKMGLNIEIVRKTPACLVYRKSAVLKGEATGINW